MVKDELQTKPKEKKTTTVLVCISDRLCVSAQLMSEGIIKVSSTDFLDATMLQ